MAEPLVIELFCGLGGWTEGFLSEGYRAVGFDVERHVYGTERYPGALVLQDVLTLHGAQFKDAAVIVASPPCQEPSYRAMPWSRAKALNEAGPPHKFMELFAACFRIQQEACAAAGRYVPLVVENVKGAQPWVGRAAWHYGSFYLWGDVPALMPSVRSLRSASKNSGTAGGSWFNIAHGARIPGNQAGAPQRGDGLKVAGHANKRDGHSHTRHLTNQDEHGVKFPGAPGRAWFDLGPAAHSSGSQSRAEASARIAKIPFELARWVATVYRPERSAAA